MDLWLERGTLALYYLILGVLAFYGVHRLMLVVAYFRLRRPNPPMPPTPEEWPMVTVQLPLYNELYVARRVIEAVAAFDYPRERLQIQVLDDSTDETTRIVAATVERLQRLGVDVEHLHRADRTGYKAGALEAGLASARGEFIVVFDADFVPQPEFLIQALPWFHDPGVGMVQARWGHLNRDYSLLTRIQAVFLDGHFAVEHLVRNRSGCYFNFNGTAGVWRRRAIEDAGGWQHDTLTEDLDLSYRAQLAGWRFLFLPQLVVPAELPVEVTAFKRQQFRWAKGSIQTAVKLLPRLLRSPIPWRARLEAAIHLTNNSCYLLMVGLSLLIFPAMVLRRGSEAWQILAIDLPLFLSATVSVLIFYLVSQTAAGRNWRDEVKRLPMLMGLGIGLAVSNCRAVLEGLVSRGGVFERTPKYSIEGIRGRTRRRYRVAGGLITLVEGVLAAYFGATIVVAWWTGMWMSIPFLYLFVQGYAYVFFLTLWNGRLAPRPRRAVLKPARTVD